MTGPGVSGHFIEGARGPIFVLLRRPPGPRVQRCVLVSPPFAEEMNKCRRMVTELAMALADRGIATVVPDLFGTGDSGGDFVQADWTVWQQDLARAADWAVSQGYTVDGVLAIRLGCAAATMALDQGLIRRVRSTVFWQPVFDGKRMLTQFLRTRVAAALARESRETVAGLRAKLRAEGQLEFAGYLMSSKLAAEIETLAVPATLPSAAGRMTWIELVREPGGDLSGPSAALIKRAGADGRSVNSLGVVGEPFWMSTEIVVNQDVIAATVAAITAGRADHAGPTSD